MANLIIKSSADNLVLQGSDASPAITVGATGTTTFAENATLSGTANNLGTVTAGSIAGGSITSATTFPAGHVIKQSFIGDEDAASAIIAESTTFTDTGLEIAHTTLLSSSDSYLIFDFYSGMVHGSAGTQNHELKVTMKAASNSTWVSGDTLTSGSFGVYFNFTGNSYQPIFMRNFCGLVSEMGMPASKSSWAAGDTLYFRLFGLRGGTGQFRVVHVNTVWNMTVTEVKR